MSLFPRTHGTTFGALAGKLLTLRRQVPFGTNPRPRSLNLLEGGRRLTLLEGFCFSMPGPFTLAGSGRQQGNGALRRGGTHVEGGRGGLITPLGGTRRDTDPQAPGIGRWQRLLGMQVNEHVRA